MCNVVPQSDEEPFQYWLRFEFGASGNPHAHGMSFVSGNPHFENVLRDEEARRQLLASGRQDVEHLQTWAQAEVELSKFFDQYVEEMHPCKD